MSENTQKSQGTCKYTVVSATVGMQRLSFKHYFWVVVLEAKVIGATLHLDLIQH